MSENMLNIQLPSSIVDLEFQPQLPTCTIFSLQHNILELENEFYSLYLYTSDLTEEEYSELYYRKESVLKDKYRLLALMRALPPQNPQHHLIQTYIPNFFLYHKTSKPIYTSLSFHHSTTSLRQTLVTDFFTRNLFSPCITSPIHTCTIPIPTPIEHTSELRRNPKGDSVIDRTREYYKHITEPVYMILKTIKGKKKKKRGKKSAKTTKREEEEEIYYRPFPTLSSWIFPLFSFTPLYATLPSTHSHWHTYPYVSRLCPHAPPFHPYTHTYTTPYPYAHTILSPHAKVFFPACTNPPVITHLATPNTHDTYNPVDPLAVWKCSNCRRNNFLCLTENICCTCYKPRNAPNPRAPPRILYHDPDYFSDDDTITTPFHRYTMYKEEPVYCDDDTLSWDTVSDSVFEELELGSMSCVAPEEYTVPSTPTYPPCNTYIHKTVLTQSTPSITSPQPSTLPLPDIVRATHTLNFLLQLPTPPPSKDTKGYRQHHHTPITSNKPYTLTPHAQTPARTTHNPPHANPLVIFVHKHVKIAHIALALHNSNTHRTLVEQSHKNLLHVITHRTKQTQHPVCFAHNPSYVNTSSKSAQTFQCYILLPFFLFYSLLSSTLSAFIPHVALVVGIG